MGMSKRIWERMMEEMMGDFSSLEQMSDWLRNPPEEQKLTSQVIDLDKGDYKNKVTVYFDQNGQLVRISSSSELVRKGPKLEDLQKLLTEAVESEDYSKAAEIQKQLKLLDKPTK